MPTHPVDRRLFLSACGIAGVALALPSSASAAGHRLPVGDSPPEPTQPPEVVREMVGVSHGNLERVRELLEEDPELAKASWDWGFGDWESALGAAAHTGSREIALLLCENGARMNLFAAAMLGDLAIVRAFIESRPGIQKTLGPHGLTLLHHARTGGEHAANVVQYLEEIGDADNAPQPVELDAAERAKLVGDYRAATEPPLTIAIEERDNRDSLTLRYGQNTTRTLYESHQPGVFAIGGASSVHIAFDRNGEGIAVRVHIRWGRGKGRVVSGVRV